MASTTFGITPTDGCLAHPMMAAPSFAAERPGLKRLAPDADITFTTPTKRINDGEGLNFFLSSIAYRDLMTWIFQLNRSMFPTRDSSGQVAESSLKSPPQFSQTIQNLRSLIADLRALVKEAPPETGPRRFGNLAFRAWSKLADERAVELLQTHLADVLDDYRGGGDDEDGNEQRQTALLHELKVYLVGALGSAQRLDYGTGHELSFLAFLACLWKLGAFEAGQERAIVVGVVQPYLELIRTLVLTYTLEPAGSHGVWGLDDHSFAPYIFGSAQLGPAINANATSAPVPTEGSSPTAPAPSSVADKAVVADYSASNMYFSAIQFIYDVKTGPFWEHSPVLFDISGIRDGWGKINKGMLKMYAAEVLGKFPVVQHFPFGSLFAWERDPEAGADALRASVHARQQPRSMDVPPPPGRGAGTKAPWAMPAAVTTVPSSRANAGLPGTKAPWAATPTVRPAPSGSDKAPTAAPWTATSRSRVPNRGQER